MNELKSLYSFKKFQNSKYVNNFGAAHTMLFALCELPFVSVKCIYSSGS